MKRRYGVVWGPLDKPIRCACCAEGGFYNGYYEDLPQLVWDNRSDAEDYCADRNKESAALGSVPDYEVVDL